MTTRRLDYQGALSEDEGGDEGFDTRHHEHFHDEDAGSEGSIERNSLEIDGSGSTENGDELAPAKGTP